MLTTVATILGWAIALVLAVLLVVLTTRWRTALGTKEWVLAPVDEVRKAVARLDQLTRETKSTAKEASEARQAAGDTRDEFGILRTELEQKSKELRELRLGSEFHARRPLLLAVARAVTMIDEDEAKSISPDQTIAGLRVELSEVLEDNGVEIVTPVVGESFQQRGIDMASVQTRDTTDESLAGTVVEVDGAAYIYRGVAGAEELLVPARVRVYRLQES